MSEACVQVSFGGYTSQGGNPCLGKGLGLGRPGGGGGGVGGLAVITRQFDIGHDFPHYKWVILPHRQGQLEDALLLALRVILSETDPLARWLRRLAGYTCV